MTDTESTMTVNDVARATADLACVLCDLLQQKLPPADAEAWTLATLAGATVAVTIHFIDGRTEVRAGFVGGDSEPQTMLAIDFAGKALQ